MSRVPELPSRLRGRREPDTRPVITPTGRFKRNGKFSLTTARSPESVTRINPEGMKPILPEMLYIPPA
jgi:hypothetical protein